MSVQVVITLTIEMSGDDTSTGEPDGQRVVLPASPAQLWPYELQAGDNYLVVSTQIPPQLLWIDPAAPSGAAWTLKGASGDVGVPLSSALPSLIPVASITPFGATTDEGGATFYASQGQVVITSNQAVQTPIGWF